MVTFKDPYRCAQPCSHLLSAPLPEWDPAEPGVSSKVRTPFAKGLLVVFGHNAEGEMSRAGGHLAVAQRYRVALGYGVLDACEVVTWPVVNWFTAVDPGLLAGDHLGDTADGQG